MIEVIEYSNVKQRLIEFEFEENQPDNALSDWVSSFNIFPVVLLSKSNQNSGTTIDPSAIFNIKLFNNKFLPEIQMTCVDEIGFLIDDFFPLDYDTILSIFVKSTSEETMPIRMDFRITEYNPLQASIETTEKKFTVKGILDVETLHYNEFESFSDETSYNVLLDIAKKTGLGFATNISNTNDNMTWINPANTYLEFIQDVTKRAYISDNTFVWSFIDFYYNLNFVDIEKELADSTTGLQSLNTMFTSEKKEESIEDFVELYLTTSDNLAMTNKFIAKYNLNNQSFKTNLNEGYKFVTRWYDKTENTIEQVVTQENKTDNPNLIQLITEDPIVDYNWVGSFLGKVDRDNVHSNYHLALTLNEFNISKLHKITMTVTLQMVNFEIKRFQNIMIDFYDVNIIKNDIGVKEKLSGFWFVTGINYNFRRNGGATQELTLVRRDLNLTHTELHDIRKELNKKNK